MRLFGVDGCKSGWMVAREDGGGPVRVECLPNVAVISALKPDFLVIDIPIGDIPIGLADHGAPRSRPPGPLTSGHTGMLRLFRAAARHLRGKQLDVPRLTTQKH